MNFYIEIVCMIVKLLILFQKVCFYSVTFEVKTKGLNPTRFVQITTVSKVTGRPVEVNGCNIFA